MLQTKYLGSVTILSVDYDRLIESLKNAVHNIKEKVSEVEQVFLFGSFSTRKHTPESDIDLLIIVKTTTIPFLKRSLKFLDFFKGLPFDINILVYTQNELTSMLKANNRFAKEIFPSAFEL